MEFYRERILKMKQSKSNGKMGKRNSKKVQRAKCTRGGRCQGPSEQLFLLQLGISKAEYRKRKVWMKLCL